MKHLPDTLAPDQLLAELGWIRSLAHRLVADPNVAEDVLQRVCLRALERPPQHLTGLGGIRRWLSTLTRRTAAHVSRSEGRRARRERGAARPEALPSAADHAEHREALHHVVDALGTLSPAEQALLRGRYFAGRSMSQLAEQLGANEAAVRKRLSRARDRLRLVLETQAGFSGTGADDNARRQHWLTALAPFAASAHAEGLREALAATPSSSLTAQAATSSLSPSLGALTVANLSVKLLVSLGLVTALAATAWQTVQHESNPPSAKPLPKPTVSTADPVPFSLPDQAERPSPAPLTEHEAKTPLLARETPRETAVTTQATGAQLLRILELATDSFLTDDPDLQALNEVLRQMAYAASVLPETVATNPKDGSVSGWVAMQGTSLEARWHRDAEGLYSVDLELPADEGAGTDTMGRSLRLGFSDQSSRAGNVQTMVQFHPDSSVRPKSELLQPLEDGTHHAGWQLSVGPNGTTGSPIHLREERVQGMQLSATASAGAPSLTAPWAHDTSPYDAWLAALAGANP